MTESSAARTNLSSVNVDIDLSHSIGEGAFRLAFAGTYRGGNRNNQEAVCKRFKSRYQVLETEFFAADFQVADKAIEHAEQWNDWCEVGKEILVTRGYVTTSRDGRSYLVEPLIRYFTKFTSNNGWIASQASEGWAVLAMEAFSHYTYHRSGGQLIVCDLQGRHRYNKFQKSKSRFELTDPAICSRRRDYGPTDLGEKGIESFFANHKCNEFCHADGNRWASPRQTQRWFQPSQGTSMLRATATNLLGVQNKTRFTINLDPIMDYDSDDDSDDDEW